MSSDSPVALTLKQLRAALGRMHFPFEVDGAQDGRDEHADIIRQLDDYMIPRYESLDAPLLAVFGGSTGSGKSTLVNSIVREKLSQASAIRPTTRRPILLHHPDDADWFTDDRVLPLLARVTGELAAAKVENDPTTEIGLLPAGKVPQGLAILDSPDIDSVVEENRKLAAQLLAAADLWVFVTTAARYADAIPWALLDQAADRNIVIAVVLNRVPPGVGAEVRADLATRLRERGLEHAPLFVISEQELDDDGLIAAEDISPIHGWLSGLAADTAARAGVVKQTLSGAVGALAGNTAEVLTAYDQQLAALDALRWDLDQAFDAAETNVERQLSDGTLMRGEVLARWQDVVGAGEWTRKFESGVSSLRDRIFGYFKPKVPETSEVETAIEEGVHGLVLGESEQAIDQVLKSWEIFGNADSSVKYVRAELRSHDARTEAAGQLVRDWQNELLTMIREQGQSKKSTARFLALGVNALGVALIIVIFASTGGLLGGEVAVAGGTAVVAQRILEAVFGDEAVRRMTKQAKNSLRQRAIEFMAVDKAVFNRALTMDVNPEIRAEVEQALKALNNARRTEP